MAEPCFLVLARDGDPALAELRAQAPGFVRQVSPGDLSRRGWRYVAGSPGQARAVAEGEVVPCDHIAAVLCRIPALTTADLPGIQPVDRAYIASEMHAFLLAWLTQFRGLRFNAPTPGSLCGPGWQAMKWLQVAARAGLPVKQTSTIVHRAAPPALHAVPSAAAQVTVVGEHAFGTDNAELAAYGRRLAAACELSILGVRFVRDGEAWKFAAAHACPPLDAAAVAAVLRNAGVRTERCRCAA
jgi:hypothetical protein